MPPDAPARIDVICVGEEEPVQDRRRGETRSLVANFTALSMVEDQGISEVRDGFIKTGSKLGMCLHTVSELPYILVVEFLCIKL